MNHTQPTLGQRPGVRTMDLSRRGFLRGVGVTGAAAAGAGLLAACGGGSSESDGGGSGGSDEKVVNIANWPLYIDTKRVDGEKTYPTIEGFEEKTGIQVNYTEAVNDNESYYAKIRPVLQAGGDVGVDCFILTDWMAAKLINLGYLDTLDKENIPNFDNVVASLQHPTWDEDRTYSIPWQSGFTGIAYDASQTDPVTSISDLFTNPDLNGYVTALTEMRDTMGLVLLDLGYDPADFDADQWSEAIASLQAATDSGQIRQFTGNNYGQLLAKGDIKACIAWTGDVIQLQADNDNIKYVIPDAGGMLWSDNMLIPKNAQHKANAEAWMNYYYEPKVAAELSAWVNYISPVQGAKEQMLKMDPSIANNPLIFPSEEDFEKVHIFRALSDDEETEFTQQFQNVIV